MSRPALTPLDAAWLALLGHAAAALAALGLDRWERGGVRLTLASAPTVRVGDELVVTGVKAAPPDCRTCGACCASLAEDRDRHADVTPTDVARMRPRTVRLHVIEDRRRCATKAVWKAQRSGPLAGARACVCSALRGSVMGRTSCGIYEERPDVCREFEAGSRRCLESRALANMHAQETT